MKVKLFFFKSKNDCWSALGRMLFQISFITFTIFFIVDYIFPGFVTNWFNPIWLLIIAIISSIIVITKD